MTNSVAEKKKILLLTRFKYENSQILPSILYDHILNLGHEIYYADPNEISIILNGKNVNIFYENTEISDVDIVISRNSRGVVERIDEIVKVLKSKGAVIFGHEEETPFSFRKFGNHFKLLDYCPKTIYFSKSNREGILKLLKNAEIQIPFILKPEGASRGIGVTLIKDKNDYDSYFDGDEVQAFSDFIIQEYLDVLSEYRVFVLGKKSLGICEKIGEGLIAKNFAQGGKFVYFRNAEIESFVEDIAQKLNHQTLGFDVIKTKKGELKILEVNSWANFKAFGEASNINMPEKILNYYIEYADSVKRMCK